MQRVVFDVLMKNVRLGVVFNGVHSQQVLSCFHAFRRTIARLARVATHTTAARAVYHIHLIRFGNDAFVGLIRTDGANASRGAVAVHRAISLLALCLLKCELLFAREIVIVVVQLHVVCRLHVVVDYVKVFAVIVVFVLIAELVTFQFVRIAAVNLCGAFTLKKNKIFSNKQFFKKRSKGFKKKTGKSFL